MREAKSIVVARWIEELGLSRGAVCLNIGSSTRVYREEAQPHIHTNIICPMEMNGVRVVNCDMQTADGVDEVGDLLDPNFQEKLKNHGANLLLCSNLLEHLESPGKFALACENLVKPGGYGIFTVPLSYPYHPDPIDTYFRPTGFELMRLFPSWIPLAAEEIEAGTFWSDLRFSGVGRSLERVTGSLVGPKKWLSRLHRLMWLTRPYRVTLVLLQRPQMQGADRIGVVFRKERAA